MTSVCPLKMYENMHEGFDMVVFIISSSCDFTFNSETITLMTLNLQLLVVDQYAALSWFLKVAEDVREVSKSPGGLFAYCGVLLVSLRCRSYEASLFLVVV